MTRGVMIEHDIKRFILPVTCLYMSKHIRPEKQIQISSQINLQMRHELHTNITENVQQKL